MNKKLVILSVCVIFIVCLTIILLPHNKKTVMDMKSPNPENGFIVDGGPMMPPSHLEPMHVMGPMAMFEPQPDMDKIIKLSDSQRDKLKKLDVDFHHNMKLLHDEQEEVRDAYLEKMDALLSAEQFRKIQKMRMDLRKEMKKLQNKQIEILENHRNDFEAILTPEQKQLLRHKHELKNKQ